jgi:integrase
MVNPRSAGDVSLGSGPRSVNLAIDSKLRASDLVRLKVEDVCSGTVVRDRGVVIQKKRGRPVQFEITEVTRQSVERLLAGHPSVDGYLFLSRTRGRSHIPARQYARIVHRWIGNIGLDDRGFGTHWLRRTKVAKLYRKTGNLRAVQLLLGHAKIETTVHYFGVEVDDALRLAEHIEL